MKRDILIVIPIVLALVAVVILARGPEEQVVEENIRLEVMSDFTYLRSEDNLPIENLTLLFPCPNVDNQPLTTATTWALFYVDNENTVYLQASEARVYEFKGQRTENLRILSRGRGATPLGPKIQYVLDKFYPREILRITTYIGEDKKLPLGVAREVTIKDYGYAQSSAYYRHSDNWSISLAFWSQLSENTGDGYIAIETFSNIVDNAPAGSVIWLYPI
jgi:hypothetical protein